MSKKYLSGQDRFAIKATNSNTRLNSVKSSPERRSPLPSNPKVAAKNSNTRVYPSALTQPKHRESLQRSPGNRGLNSIRMRESMVQRLREQGIQDLEVLKAMYAVERHKFVDEALASRAYDDDALPIGSGQTISQPWVVAYMLEQARSGQVLGRVLEIGTGCGYQAAVLAELADTVYTIERIESLHAQAKRHLAGLVKRNIQLVYGDGMLGLPEKGLFDAIVIAAAGLKIPEILYEQLAIGGRLLAPEGKIQQTLIKVERISTNEWQRTELSPVRFVPLKSGVVDLS